MLAVGDEPSASDKPNSATSRMIDVVIASGTTRSMNPASASTQWRSAAPLLRSLVGTGGIISRRVAILPAHEANVRRRRRHRALVRADTDAAAGRPRL